MPGSSSLIAPSSELTLDILGLYALRWAMERGMMWARSAFSPGPTFFFHLIKASHGDPPPHESCEEDEASTAGEVS